MTAGAVLLYGGWAYAVNLAQPAGVACQAAATQGFTSAVSTLFMASLAELVFHRLGLSWAGILATATVPPTLTSCMHALAQWMVGTPDVVTTVLLSVVMGYVFAGLYTSWLARLARTAARPVALEARRPS